MAGSGVESFSFVLGPRPINLTDYSRLNTKELLLARRSYRFRSFILAMLVWPLEQS